MFINERIKVLRKSLEMNQQSFAESLGMTQGNVSIMERNGSTITEQNIKQLCAAFNVSEEWLRTGEGEMMSQKSKSIVDELSAIYRLDERRKRLLGNFLSLNDEDQEKLIGAIEVVARMCEGAQKEKAAPEISEADMEAYDRVNAWFDAHPEERVKKEQARPSAPSVESDAG